MYERISYLTTSMKEYLRRGEYWEASQVGLELLSLLEPGETAWPRLVKTILELAEKLDRERGARVLLRLADIVEDAGFVDYAEKVRRKALRYVKGLPSRIMRDRIERILAEPSSRVVASSTVSDLDVSRRINTLLLLARRDPGMAFYEVLELRKMIESIRDNGVKEELLKRLREAYNDIKPRPIILVDKSDVEVPAPSTVKFSLSLVNKGLLPLRAMHIQVLLNDKQVMLDNNIESLPPEHRVDEPLEIIIPKPGIHKLSARIEYMTPFGEERIEQQIASIRAIPAPVPVSTSQEARQFLLAGKEIELVELRARLVSLTRRALARIVGIYTSLGRGDREEALREYELVVKSIEGLASLMERVKKIASIMWSGCGKRLMFYEKLSTSLPSLLSEMKGLEPSNLVTRAGLIRRSISISTRAHAILTSLIDNILMIIYVESPEAAKSIAESIKSLPKSLHTSLEKEAVLALVIRTSEHPLKAIERTISLQVLDPVILSSPKTQAALREAKKQLMKIHSTLLSESLRYAGC